MIRSVVGFRNLLGATFKDAALHRFLQAIERATGLEIVADSRSLFLESAALHELAPLVDTLKKAGILLDLQPLSERFADEPRIFSWTAQYDRNDLSGGSSVASNRQALMATLAECLERYLWRYANDLHRHAISASEDGLPKRHVGIARFAGFSDAQRMQHPELRMTSKTSFLWIKARSLISGDWIYIPAQTVAGRNPIVQLDEPLIRPVITTGLATGVTQIDALLGGALEVIERDAFMIMWLNQLTLPRVNLEEIEEDNAELSMLLQQIARYRLTVDVARLITDAPAHAVCAVIRDASTTGPARILGLGCDSDLGRATAHAIAEALRIRISARHHLEKGVDLRKIIPHEIMHYEHMLYWLHDDRYKRLDFITSGPLQKHARAEWENDTSEKHLKRIVWWCRSRGYECASVDIGRSKKNPTKLFVEMVVIPELQPMHLMERFPCIGGKRLAEIPAMFGYAPRAHPFSEEPHPFV